MVKHIAKTAYPVVKEHLDSAKENSRNARQYAQGVVSDVKSEATRVYNDPKRSAQDRHEAGKLMRDSARRAKEIHEETEKTERCKWICAAGMVIAGILGCVLWAFCPNAKSDDDQYSA